MLSAVWWYCFKIKRGFKQMEKSKNRSVWIILIAWLVYLISYIGRADYSTCLLEVLNDTGATRATAGMVTSAFAFCNAFGQLASAYVIKKIAPFKVIVAELFSVAIINLLFPLTDSFVVMAILWGINGAMQSTLLCGITCIFAETLREPYLSRGAVLLNTIGAVAGLFSYLLSWVLIRYADWRMVFFFASTLLFVLGFVWLTVMPRLLSQSTVKTSAVVVEKQENASVPLLFVLKAYGTICVILAAFFIGTLRESVSLWIPSYINERFGLSSSLSIVVTAFVPCLQVCGALLAGRLGKMNCNLPLRAGTCFSCSAVCLLLILMSGNVAITIFLFVINAVAMTAALTFLLSLFPVRYVTGGHIATVVGITNFFVHAGDFFASMGIGWVSQAGGWNIAFTILCSFAILGAGICALGSYLFRKDIKKYGNHQVSR